MADCNISDDEVKKDAKFMGGLLQQGDVDFVYQYSKNYGLNAPKECALQNFVKELYKIDPDDVHLLEQINHKKELGVIKAEFPADSPDKNMEGFKIDLWKVLCSHVVSELKHNTKTPEEVTAEIRNNLAEKDYDRFTKEFEKQKGTLGYKIAVDESKTIKVVDS